MDRKKLALFVGLSLCWILQLNGQIISEIDLDQNWLDSKKALFSNDKLLVKPIQQTNKVLSVDAKSPLLNFHKTDLMQENFERQGKKRYYILEKEVNEARMSSMPKAMIPDGVKYHLLIKKL